MGREIASGAFDEAARAEFASRLREETRILKPWFDVKGFAHSAV